MVNPLLLYTEEYDLEAEGNWMMEKDQWGRRIVDPDEYLQMRRAEAMKQAKTHSKFLLLLRLGTLLAIIMPLCVLLWFVTQ